MTDALNGVAALQRTGVALVGGGILAWDGTGSNKNGEGKSEEGGDASKHYE